MSVLRRTAFWTCERLRGRPTRGLVADMARAEALSPVEVQALQDRRVAAFVGRAAREVPFVRDRFAELGLDADSIRSAADLTRLPLLDKQTIREAGDFLRHPDGGPFRLTETGGSTGDPLRIHESPLRQAVAVAARIRSRSWWDIHPGDLEIVLFGGPVRPTPGGLVRALKDELLGSVTYSAFGMTEEHFDRVMARIRRSRPRHLFGYTSALCALARYLRDSRGRADAAADCSVEVLFTTSEMLFPADRKLLEETFGAAVADGYGSKEGGFVAHQARDGHMYVRADTHVVEIVRDGEVQPWGEDGEIVLTHLGDWHWPFLRYRTGDMGRLLPPEPGAPLPFPVLEMRGGRITDLLVRPDGGLVHGLGAIYPLRETPGVEQFQVHQRSIDEIDVAVVRGVGYPLDGDERIRERLRETLGGARIHVRHVERIEQAASGKYRVVRSDVAPSHL